MASEDSEKIDTMESETEQFFPGQKRRPRLTMDELISLKDFKESKDSSEVQQKYAKKAIHPTCSNIPQTVLAPKTTIYIYMY